MRTDRNTRERRRPDVRNPVERFRRRMKRDGMGCQSRSLTPHGGPIEVHHRGGVFTRPRLVAMCRKHNRLASGVAWTGRARADGRSWLEAAWGRLARALRDV